MANETKVGVAVFAVLVGVFGFVLYRKYDDRMTAMAGLEPAAGATAEAGADSGPLGDDGTGPIAAVGAATDDFSPGLFGGEPEADFAAADPAASPAGWGGPDDPLEGGGADLDADSFAAVDAAASDWGAAPTDPAPPAGGGGYDVADAAPAAGDDGGAEPRWGGEDSYEDAPTMTAEAAPAEADPFAAELANLDPAPAAPTAESFPEPAPPTAEPVVAAVDWPAEEPADFPADPPVEEPVVAVSEPAAEFPAEPAMTSFDAFAAAETDFGAAPVAPAEPQPEPAAVAAFDFGGPEPAADPAPLPVDPAPAADAAVAFWGAEEEGLTEAPEPAAVAAADPFIEEPPTEDAWGASPAAVASDAGPTADPFAADPPPVPPADPAPAAVAATADPFAAATSEEPPAAAPADPWGAAEFAQGPSVDAEPVAVTEAAPAAVDWSADPAPTGFPAAPPAELAAAPPAAPVVEQPAMDEWADLAAPPAAPARPVAAAEPPAAPETEPFPVASAPPAAAPPRRDGRVRPAAAQADRPFTFRTPDERHTEVVRDGDSYWTLTKRVYGSGKYTHALARYNSRRIRDANKLQPKMIVVCPAPAKLLPYDPDLAAAERAAANRAARGASGPRPSWTGFAVDDRGRPVYRVAPGDTLGAIAQKHLGRYSRAEQILRLNRDKIRDPDRLKVGVLLDLPADAAGVRRR